MHKSNVTCHAKRDGVALYYDNGRRVFLRAEEELKIEEVTEHFEKDSFTADQNYYYKLAVYGLSSVRPEDLKKMSPNQLKNARKLFLRSQKELNRMKNERLDIIFERLMPKLFRRKGENVPIVQSPIARTLMTDCSDEYDNVKNLLNFDTLGITKQMIVKRLIDAKILKSSLFNI